MSKLRVNCSWKSKTLINTATTGSNAPKIAAGVEPIYLMVNTKHTLEITVVKNAKIVKLKKVLTSGIIKD